MADDWSLDDNIPDKENPYRITGSPALAAFKRKLYCVYAGYDDSSKLFYSSFDGTYWSRKKCTLY